MFNEPNSYDGGGGGSGYGFSIDGGSKGYTDDKPSERKNKKVASVSVDGRSQVLNQTSRRAAMREAKRSVNIPMSEQPSSKEKVKMVGADGRTVFAELEIYGKKFIRNDLGGHLFNDGTSLPRHFNSGTIDESGNLIQKRMHFWY